jgi:hypothetical protein
MSFIAAGGVTNGSAALDGFWFKEH